MKENTMVMLISKIDTPYGLVNGVNRTIVKIPHYQSEKLPQYIAVEFDDKLLERQHNIHLAVFQTSVPLDIPSWQS